LGQQAAVLWVKSHAPPDGNGQMSYASVRAPRMGILLLLWSSPTKAWLGRRGGIDCKCATLTFQGVVDDLDVVVVGDDVCQNELHATSRLGASMRAHEIRLGVIGLVIVMFDPLGAVRGLGTTKVCKVCRLSAARSRKGEAATVFVAGLARLSRSSSVWRGPARTVA
jgi:hypothetical protein